MDDHLAAPARMVPLPALNEPVRLQIVVNHADGGGTVPVAPSAEDQGWQLVRIGPYLPVHRRWGEGADDVAGVHALAFGRVSPS